MVKELSDPSFNCCLHKSTIGEVAHYVFPYCHKDSNYYSCQPGLIGCNMKLLNVNFKKLFTIMVKFLPLL